jgi:hypothetical protein
MNPAGENPDVAPAVFGPEVTPGALFAVKRKPSAWFWGEQWPLEVLVKKVESGEINRAALVRPANQAGGGTGVMTAGECCDRFKSFTAATNRKSVSAAGSLPDPAGTPAPVAKKPVTLRNQKGRGWRAAAGFALVIATVVIPWLLDQMGFFPPPNPRPVGFYIAPLAVYYLLFELFVLPLVAVVLAIMRPTRFFGLGMLLASGLGWLVLLSLCGGFWR